MTSQLHPTNAEEFAAEVDRQITEYECVSDEAIENVVDDLIFNHGVSAAEVDKMALDHFRFRLVES